ncbi:MAG: dolichyl-phosphate beta-glucosyltransferase [Vicinamibacterales bacterium]
MNAKHNACGHEPHLSVVIPAFNEERRLPATLDSLRDWLSSQPWTWEIRVVDDGSEDSTASVVEERSAKDPRIVLQCERHAGKGATLKAGMLAATGAFRFMCDADLSMPVGEIPRFLPPRLTGFDVAIGSREGQGASRIGEPFIRHAVGRIFNTAIKRIVLGGIEDTQCGFKMFTAASARSIFPLVTVSGWAFDVEVLAIARRRGMRIVEVPVEWHYRSESRVSFFRDSPRMFRDLLRIRARMRRGCYDPPARRSPADAPAGE